MIDFIQQLFFLVEENLPLIPMDHEAEDALTGSFSPEQKALYEAYQEELFRNQTRELLQLFRYLLSLGLYVPQAFATEEDAALH